MDNTDTCGIWDKTGDCIVPVEDLAKLPRYHRETIPSEYLDAMGHMNVRWYMALFDTSVWQFFDFYGLNKAYFTQKNSGVFALKHFIQYFSEVKVGETVAMRIRLLGRSEKRFHFMNFMINESTGKLAATLEVLGTHADLNIRRASPMPADIVQRFDDRLREDQGLDWDAPVSGTMALNK